MTNAIELRHLRHFMALAEELHFGRAAKRCNISQPPFSVSIQQLEAELGFALVERSSHGVRLTTAGAAFYEETGKALSQMKYACDVAERVNGGLEGVLKIGFFASMLHRGLDRAVAQFEASFPGVEVQLVELNTAEQIPALARHEIQYGFLHSESLPAEIESHELQREPFVLCLPASHPKAQRRKLKLQDVQNESFIFFARAYSPAYHDQVISLCVEAGFQPRIRYEARHWLTVISCVSKGMGISLVPRSLAHAGFPNLRFAEIGRSPIQSILRGGWLKSNADNAILAKWRVAVEREIATRTVRPEGA